MNTSIRNILREGLILEASKKQILIQKIGWNDESADILDRLCGPLSVFIGNKIIEYKIEDYGKFPEGTTPQEIKKIILGDLNYNRFVFLNRQYITSIMDWVRVGLNGNLGENKALSFWDLYKASEKWHDELEVGSGDINYVEENPVILDFRGSDGLGYYWADLQTSNSSEECERMGHCGRSGAGMIYSLRQVINKILFYAQLRGYQNRPAPQELDDTVKSYIEAFNAKYDFKEYEKYLNREKSGLKDVVEETEDRYVLPF